MIRLSNRNHAEKQFASPQVQHIERIIEVPVEKIVEVPVEVEVERVVEHTIIERQVEAAAPAPVVDLQPLHDRYNQMAQVLVESHNRNANAIDELKTQHELQGRALLELRRQRLLDRSRRLMLIKKMKKHQVNKKKDKLKLKLAVGASLLLSVISMFIK